MGGVAAHSSRRSILTKTANFKSNLKKYKPSTEYKRTGELEKTPQPLLLPFLVLANKVHPSVTMSTTTTTKGKVFLLVH